MSRRGAAQPLGVTVLAGLTGVTMRTYLAILLGLALGTAIALAVAAREELDAEGSR
jgi:uncharacterized membrane protein YdjX (TVP38/TMEM64 family)